MWSWEELYCRPHYSDRQSCIWSWTVIFNLVGIQVMKCGHRFILLHYSLSASNTVKLVKNDVVIAKEVLIQWNGNDHSFPLWALHMNVMNGQVRLVFLLCTCLKTDWSLMRGMPEPWPAKSGWENAVSHGDYETYDDIRSRLRAGNPGQITQENNIRVSDSMFLCVHMMQSFSCCHSLGRAVNSY